VLLAAAAHAQDVAPGAIRDFSGASLGFAGSTRDIAGTIVNMGGKSQALQVKETDAEIRIELAADVLFDFDKDVIRPDAASALHSVAEIITSKGKGRNVRVEGHTDGKGGAAYNQKLSERRAESVRQWLAQKEGLADIKMSTKGFGATRPVAPNAKPDGSDDPAGRQKNRRVEIVLAK
jgi:outer membrane protein OmpA-like peptidoglycan-associated protein